MKKEAIPNAITHSRFALIPVFLALWWASPVWALFVFYVCYISDVADGYLARRWRVSSAYGALMDPLADKLIVLCAILIGISQGWFPLWLAIVLESRESIATAVRMTALEAKGLVIGSGYWGKRKADSQMTGLTLLMAAHIGSNAEWVVIVGSSALICWCLWSKNWDVLFFAAITTALGFFPAAWMLAGMVFLTISAGMALFSLVQYGLKAYRAFNPPPVC